MQRCSYLVTTVLHWSAVLLLQFCRQVSEACCIYVQASVTSAISSDCTGFVRDLNVISTTLHLSFAQIVTLSCPDFWFCTFAFWRWTSPVCPNNSRMPMRMRIVRWWNYTDRRKLKSSGQWGNGTDRGKLKNSGKWWNDTDRAKLNNSGQWWNGIDRAKLKNCGQCLSQCNVVRQNSQIDWTGLTWPDLAWDRHRELHDERPFESLHERWHGLNSWVWSGLLAFICQI